MGNIIRSTHILIIINMVSITHILGLVKFTIPKTDVVHPKSGLVLHYLSEYHPANKIITFTVILPMYLDMCYLIPYEAMGKIAVCNAQEAVIREIREIRKKIQDKRSLQTRLDEMKRNNTILIKQQEAERNKTELFVKMSRRITPTIQSRVTFSLKTKPTTTFKTTRTSTVTKTTPRRNYTNLSKYSLSHISYPRKKRTVPAILAIGAGIASTAISAVNLIQMGNMKAQMREVKESLQALHLATVDNHAQLFHLHEGQFKLAQQLGNTQNALNKTIDLVNRHSDILRVHAEALRVAVTQTKLLRDKLATAEQAMESHFIHESIEHILSNKLNLFFVHHQDMPRVIREISRAMNLSVNEFRTVIPMVEIITRLFVRQQIDFAPMPKIAQLEKGVIVGKMIFTSYFAAPARDQDPFSIYESVAIPSNKGKRRVQLAKMPAYLGMEHKSQQFIRGSKEEAATCDFEVMPSCRESPVRRKDYEDDCIHQILTDSILKDCRIESFPDKVFIRQVGQHWAISTYNQSKCHAVPSNDLDEHLLVDNEEVTLPETALITVKNEKALVCDRFIIPKTPTKVGTPINLIYNESISPSYKVLINLQEALENETNWLKLPYITSDMQEVMDFISNTPKSVATNNFKIWGDHPLSLTMITIIGTLILVIIVLVFFIYRRKKMGGITNRITIAMPTMKELETRKAALDAELEKY